MTTCICEPHAPAPADEDTPIWDHMVGARYDLPPGAPSCEAFSTISPLTPISEGDVTLAMRPATVDDDSDHNSDQHSDQDQGTPNAADNGCSNSA